MTWEYVAGFTDGEGHVKWRKGKENGSGRGPIVIIGQLDKRPLEAIKDFLVEAGCEKVSLYLRPPIRDKRGHGSNPAWILYLHNCYDVGIFLRGTIPHLILKKEEAEECLQQIESPSRKHVRALRDEEIVPLLDQGLTAQGIALALGCGRKKIDNYLHQRGISGVARKRGMIWGPDDNGISRYRPSMSREEYRQYKNKLEMINKCPDCGKGIYRNSERCISCHMKKRHREQPWTFKASAMRSANVVESQNGGLERR